MPPLFMAVTVETDKRDRYGREVGKMLVKSVYANLMQIERGKAWWYRTYKKGQLASDRLLYEAAETSAMAKKMGLWADAKPMPPWEFRRKSK